MSKSSKQRAASLSIRFTPEEKTLLAQRANGLPLGAYIRDLALSGQSTPRMASRRAPVKDAEPLGQLLALLGQSHLSSNLNQLAKAANQGALPVTAEVEADLREACAAVLEIRLLLLKALGFKLLESASPSAKDAFTRRATS